MAKKPEPQEIVLNPEPVFPGLHEAADGVRGLDRMFRSVSRLAEYAGEVGKWENAKAEAISQMKEAHSRRATHEAASARAQADVLRANEEALRLLAEARATGQAAIERAQADAQQMAVSTKAAAEQYRAKEELRLTHSAKNAQAELDIIAGTRVSITEEIAGLTRHRDELKKERDKLQTAIDRLRQSIAGV
jgi:chromosome segregation ATPase